jgi:hypothetical protein
MDKWPDSNQLGIYEPPRLPRPPTLAADRQAGIVSRRFEIGLPVTADIVSEVLAATGPNGRSGVYTDAEEADTYDGNERSDRAMEVLADADDVLAGIDLCWLQGRQAVRVWLTGELDHYRQLLIEALGAERVAVEQARYSIRESGELHGRVRTDEAELAEQGIYVTSSGASRDGVAVGYYAADFAFADRLLHDRYGAFARIRYKGASRDAIKNHPFGGWHATGNQLHVFYARPHNREQSGTATTLEQDDCVIVSLTIVDSLLPKRQGHRPTPSHLTIDLSQPLGTRTVIDNSENRARPHWTEVPRALDPRRRGHAST